ncbi:SHOCT domain-containing protein [Microbacterium saperdae]|uniref:Putative oligomerization/nucleic acid binding protein n=1 Tax=Microbacterium saperdae TaxID=69368 RepID=A0A543BCV9_9MICO|nr:SHOCT domain-containing protein [Microbacterium saperdae]TQL82626.1 putative oligomerization/nucleic acid binding protein [Microbacterium saperdae]
MGGAGRRAGGGIGCPGPARRACEGGSPAVDTQQLIGQLQQLGQLRDAGVLTEAEFTTQKQRLLGS